MLQELLTDTDVPEGAPEANGQSSEAGGTRSAELEWYANWFAVGHNALQFRIDCARTLTHDDEEPAMYIRVTSDALHARQLFQLLGVELIAFMDMHGPIAPDTTRGDAP